MRRGVDTNFLVQVEVAGHPAHEQAERKLAELVNAGDTLALTPGCLAEFIHVVSDPRRFDEPLTMIQAAQCAESWWYANEIEQLFPDQAAVAQALQWLRHFRLGRKRILDTMLAATFHVHGITSIVTTNAVDYRVFGVFDIVTP